MPFFFSGELDIELADSYQEVRKIVENTLNENRKENDYGNVIELIGIIPIIVGPRFIDKRKERRLIQHKRKATDYRLFIDFDKWMSGDLEERIKLLIDNVLTAIDDIDRKLKGEFKGESLKNDIQNIFGIV